MADLIDACIEICGTHLPEESGYEVARSSLTGPVEGVSLRLRRGTFRATISIQRFERWVGSGDPTDQTRTLRLVASAHHGVPPDEAAQSRSAAYWTATGGAAGTMAVGIVALALTGAITAWGSLLLLVPALFGTRVCMAMWMADSIRQQALPAAPAEQAQSSARSRYEARDLRRWSAVVDELQGQQQVAAELFSLRPFRGMSSGPHPVVASAPLAASPLTPALKPASLG